MDELVRTYQESLYWYLRRMLKNTEDAKDVLQNTWLQIYTHLGELREQSSERAYVYKVATNCAFSWLRDQKVLDSIEEIDETLISSIPSDKFVDIAREIETNLEQTILRLPPMQRAVFNLRYHDELSYEEIAEITSTTVNSAKVNYSLAKGKISHWMTAMVASVALVVTLGIGWGYSAKSARPLYSSENIIYAGETWLDFAEDDVFIDNYEL